MIFKNFEKNSENEILFYAFWITGVNTDSKIIYLGKNFNFY